MKKSFKEQIPLDPRDQLVKVELPEHSKEIPDDDLRAWVTDVCSKVFSVAFNFYIKDELNYSQAKVFCSEGILKNIVLLT